MGQWGLAHHWRSVIMWRWCEGSSLAQCHHVARVRDKCDTVTFDLQKNPILDCDENTTHIPASPASRHSVADEPVAVADEPVAVADEPVASTHRH
jgi:hypothetical protein